MELNLDKKVVFFIVIAFVFSILVRLIWVYQFYGYEPFIWNGQFMINTNDGYFYAEGARDIINGFHQPNDLSPVDTTLSKLTAFFYKILPFSFETILFYMSAFLSSLVVIPVILIANNLKQLEVGFIAALLSSIAWSYYNRTMVGYYDTDMLNIVLPSFLLWSLMLALKTKEDKYLLFTAFEIIIYRAWYPQSYSLEFAFFSLLFIFAIYQYFKKEDYKFTLTLLTFMMFAMMNLDGFIRLTVVLILFISLKKGFFEKYLYYLFGLSVILFFITGGFNPIWGKLKGYVFKDTISSTKDVLNLHFFTVMQTVREAGKIPFEVFANRISGHSATFLLSIVGYIWMTKKYPIMLLGLPLIGLGFLAYVGGLRFTIYAVPVLALGIAFLIVNIASYIENRLVQKLLIGFLSALILVPNILHVIDYKVPTVFVKDEVKVLDNLKHIANREDYVISWWDYGYPIRYYSDVKTLVDGGKHSGKVNFPVSYILTHEQIKSAKLARFDVEYTEKRFNFKNDSIEYNRTNIAQMTLDNGFNDVNDFLNSLEFEEIKLPKKTRDIYLYLPNRMMQIYPTVAKFSDIDVMSGKFIRKPLFLVSHRFTKQNENIIMIASGLKLILNLNKAVLRINKKDIKINSFIITQIDKNKKLHVNKQTFNPFSNIYVIYMKNYNQILVVDKDTFNSTYIQLFVLENYDKRYFEPIILTPYAKVFKLKV